jgi:uncharacterized membrane protein YcfT
LLWADTAKGACIVLVVLWHVTRKDYLELPWHVGVPVVGAWGELSVLLLPVRMPLFFVISGLFAARQLDRPWRQVLTGRVAPLLYVFVLWTVVHSAVLQATPGFDTAVANGPLDLLVQLTITPGNLWYLLALASYVVVARGTRAHPHLTLAGALLLSAVASTLAPSLPGNRYGLLANLVFFLLGTRLTHLRVPGQRWLLTLTAGFVVAAALWQLQVLGNSWFGFRPVLGLIGLSAGATASMGLARLPRVGPVLAALGRQTLPIYVLHLPLVALAHLVSVHAVSGRAAGSLVLAASYPAVLTAVVVITCLALHRLLVAVGAGRLFTAPWLSRQPVRATAAAERRRLPA